MDGTSEYGWFRGVPVVSMATVLRDFGYQGKKKRNMLKQIGEAAETASRSMWNWSHFREWGRQR